MGRPKSSNPSRQAWHRRTQKAFPIEGKRCVCGRPAQIRHHKNGKVDDLSPKNIQLLCRRCHVRLDPRIKPH